VDVQRNFIGGRGLGRHLEIERPVCPQFHVVW
jgi:hypothetical protein